MELTPRQTVLVAILVLYIGRVLTKRFMFLKEYNIPEPVSGGIFASLFFCSIYVFFDYQINFSLLQRDILLVVFFTAIGLNSQFSTLLKGGKALAVLLGISVTYLFLQNLTGIGVAIGTGLNPLVGVLGGSVSLSGGHGTAIAWSPLFLNDYNIAGATEIGIACATFGLVFGGVIGGPIAKYLIKKYDLKSTEDKNISVGFSDEKSHNINVDSMLKVLFVLSLAVGLGMHLDKLLNFYEIKLPLFVSCLFGGILFSNTIPYLLKDKTKWISDTPTLALISDLSLGLFLSMSLMSLQLWSLIDLAGPLILLLIAQVLMITLFTIFVVFRLLGKNYDAAIISAGYAGLALGATPTAIANMTAVTKKFGASSKAFIVVPLIGAFFIDIANAVIIQLFISWSN